MEQQPKYVLYPSLLIAYQNLLDYENVAEEDWNKVSEASHKRGEYLDIEIGDYKLAPNDMYVKLEAELIDTINRVDGKFGEAAEKGTAFNEIVDCLIEKRGSNREDCVITSMYLGGGTCVKEWLDANKSNIGENAYYRCLAQLNKSKVIRAEINGFTFDFDVNLCTQTAEYFKGSVTQFKAESCIDTKYGPVRLYGFIDEWVGNKMYDIKTTGRYNFGKYENGWQRHVYPWCVVESGLTTELESFTYFVVEWAYQRKGEPLTAKNVYEETYSYNHGESEVKIRQICERFIEWLESRREFIQDKKIFGGTNPEGWHGTPIEPKELTA